MSAETKELVSENSENPATCPSVNHFGELLLWSESRSVMSDSLWPHGLYSTWNSPGQNTGVGSLSLLQEIFPTQGLNPGLPHCGQILFFFFCSGFCHTLKWNSHGFTCIPHPDIPPPTSLSTRSLQVFPVHQVRALVSCIQPGLVICFTLDNMHVSMLFSWTIPPSPSPTESKRLFYTSVSLFLFCI